MTRASWIWLASLAGGFGLFAWTIRTALAPFIIGFAVAYLLTPLVDWLERQGIGRTLCVSIVLIVFLILVSGSSLLLLPLFHLQATHLSSLIPRLTVWGQQQLLPWIEHLMGEINPASYEQLRTALGQMSGDALQWVGAVIRDILSRGIVVIDIITVMIVSPVAAFYLLRDWDELVTTVDNWLPPAYAPTIRAQITQIDRTLAGFARGQAIVCVIVAIIYAISLTLAGLEFGLTVGILIGFLTIVPYIGTAFGLALCLSLAMFQFDTWDRVIIIVAIFAIGHLFESYALTPRLVGKSVSLHPLWVLLSLLAGGVLFGFVGVLVAVPAAAVIGVLARFCIKRYLESAFYRGSSRSA